MNLNFRYPQNYSVYATPNIPIQIKDITIDNYQAIYYDPLINLMRDHIEDEVIMRIKYTIVLEDDEVIKLNPIDLFINMNLWYLTIMSGIKTTGKYVIFDELLNPENMYKFMDNIILTLIDKCDKKFINNILADTIIRFNIIDEFAYFICNTISLFDIIDLAERNKNVNKILNTNFTSNSTVTKIKDKTDSLSEKFKEEILVDKLSSLYAYISIKTGFDLRQFKECLIAIGVKPDGLGGVFDKPVYNSYLDGGISDPIAYAIDAATARISQIIIESNVGKSGDFSNRLSYNNIDTLLHHDPNYICNTKHYNLVNINSEKDLKDFANRYYKRIGTDIEYCLSEHDTHLIGETIQVRTPMKCASYINGTGVCFRCYGKMAYINKGLNIGKIAADTLASACTQPQLSSKHILDVKFVKYEWGEEFDKYFTEEEYIIRCKPTPNTKCKLIIEAKNVIEDIEEDSEMFKITSFHVEDIDGELSYISYPDNVNQLIILSPLLKLMEKYKPTNEDDDDDLIIIPLDELDGLECFASPILNNDLINIINNSKKYISTKSTIVEELNKGTDLSEFARLFRKAVCDDAGLKVSPIHLETLMAAQIYTDDTCEERPDWSRNNVDWTLVDLATSNKKNPSVIISLINGYLSSIMNKVSTFTKENPSVLDGLYSTNLKRYYDGRIIEDPIFKDKGKNLQELFKWKDEVIKEEDDNDEE